MVMTRVTGKFADIWPFLLLGAELNIFPSTTGKSRSSRTMQLLKESFDIIFLFHWMLKSLLSMHFSVNKNKMDLIWIHEIILNLSSQLIHLVSNQIILNIRLKYSCLLFESQWKWEREGEGNRGKEDRDRERKRGKRDRQTDRQTTTETVVVDTLYKTLTMTERQRDRERLKASQNDILTFSIFYTIKELVYLQSSYGTFQYLEIKSRHS